MEMPSIEKVFGAFTAFQQTALVVQKLVISKK